MTPSDGILPQPDGPRMQEFAAPDLETQLVVDALAAQRDIDAIEHDDGTMRGPSRAAT